jgi:hypothetical protein
MNIPAAWTEALTRLHKVGFTEAFIGGGALRDLDHRVSPKDRAHDHHAGRYAVL